MFVNHPEELLDYRVRRVRSIEEKQIVVVDPCFLEVLLVVLVFVQSDHQPNVLLFEDLDVLGWVVAEPLLFVLALKGPHVCDELARDDPVEVSVFDLFIELVLLDVESLEVVPVQSYGVLQSLKAVEQSALVVALTFACISVRLKLVDVLPEACVGLFGGITQDNDLETPHQECAVDHLRGFRTRTVVEDSTLLVGLVSQQPSQLPSESVGVCKRVGTEVFIEWKVHQVIVDVEKEGVLVVLRRLLVSYPEQFVYRTSRSNSQFPITYP